MATPAQRPQLNGRGVITLDRPCPVCAEANETTVGGYTPFLRVVDLADLHEGERTDPFCHTHGYVSA